MSPLYSWFLLFHVVAALWLTAGVFASAVVRVQGRRASTALERALVARLLWRLHVVYTLPGLVLGGLLGFYLVTAGGFRFAETWVMASAFLYLLMFLLTLFALTPALSQQRRAAEQAASTEAPSPPAAPLTKLPGILSDVNALFILALVFLMVIKP
jgi:uncharacterized membrane protein